MRKDKKRELEGKRKGEKCAIGSTSTEPKEMGTLLQYVIPSSHKKQRPFPYVLYS